MSIFNMFAKRKVAADSSQDQYMIIDVDDMVQPRSISFPEEEDDDDDWDDDDDDDD